MKKILALSLIVASPTFAKGFPDGSSLSSPAIAKCAAAALKFDMQLWKKWYAATKGRYEIIYKDKMSAKEIESYTMERVFDKKAKLQREGFDSKRAFKKYFKMNCEGEL